MPFDLKVKEDPQDIKVVAKQKHVKKIKLVISKTLEGNVIIKDHDQINIIVMPEKGKILALPKGEYSEEVYAYQDKLFDYLLRNGVIVPDSVNGGNIYGSIEAKFPMEKKYEEEPLDVILYNIDRYIETHRQESAIKKKYIDDIENELLNPDGDHTTDLGEIPQERTKGSIPKWGYPVRGMYRYNY
jgi:hypothetical protein